MLRRTPESRLWAGIVESRLERSAVTHPDGEGCEPGTEP